MPPKKRDKDGESSKNPRMDHAQADHELFLQAFEKPTQIYRFLRTRNMVSPVFLNRTLSYMPERMSRNNKKRRGFKIDSLLEKVQLKSKRLEMPSNLLTGYMNLTFLGFYDKTLESHPQSAQVETVLLKICHKKRKDSSSPIMKVSFGTNEVAINPSDHTPPIQVPTTSISTDSFSLSDSSVVKSYILLLNVQYFPSITNGNESEDEPALKRRKSTSNIIRAYHDQKIFASELVVYDKHNRCLLSDGDYELSLTEMPTTIRNSPKKPFSWDAPDQGIIDEYEPFKCFNKSPLLKFNLSWSHEPIRGLVDRPKPFSVSENKENIVPQKQRPQQTNTNNVKVNRLQIIYQFTYNNNSRQQTEACEDLHCPWCSLNCIALYPLLKHLKLCHSRFTFTYVPITLGARIDVAINELYDGSYNGSPHDLISQPLIAFSRNGPVRRACVTNILVCRPKRSGANINEFLELDEGEFDGQRPYITGHNRLYHHTTTCLPIYPKELDQDSEGENDPQWLQHKTMMMIDEFTDVNEGEKELMKMWNLHVMKFGYVGDCQIPLACTMFLQHKGKELLLKNLYRNFVLHLCSLFDFGLISPVTLYNTIKKLQEMAVENGAIRKVMKDSRDAQMEHWVKTGVFQQPAIDRNVAVTKTPTTGRKAGNPSSSGLQRRKGTPSVEMPLRRKSGGESTSRKRLSLSLKKDETQGKPLSS